MIIKYIWHERHCMNEEKKSSLTCLLCTTIHFFSLHVIIFLFLAADHSIWAKSWQTFYNNFSWSFSFGFLCSLFFWIGSFRSLAYNKLSFTHTFDAKFRAGKVDAWNQRMNKTKKNFVFDVHEFFIRWWCLWLVFSFF